jgi:mono/diheme cytochrome c family protein
VAALAVRRVFLAAIFAALLLPVAAAELAANPTDSKLRYLLSRFCVLCHGPQLQGDKGPPLRPDALKLKTDGQLVSRIFFGHESPRMPAWNGSLTHAEADRLVAMLRAGVTLPD